MRTKLIGWAAGRLELLEGGMAEGIQDVDAIEDQCVEVDVQIQRTAETLHGHHCAGESLAGGTQPQRLPCLQALKSEDLLHDGLRDRPTELAVISQEVAEHFRQAEHELAQGHRGQHPLAQPGGTFVHSSSAARWAEPAPLAREGHQPVEAAAEAVDAGETFLQIPAAKVRLKFPAHEGWQGSSLGLTAIPHPRPEPAEAAMQDGLVRAPGGIGTGRVH